MMVAQWASSKPSRIKRSLPGERTVRSGAVGFTH